MKKKIYLLPGIMCNALLWKELLSYFDENYEFIHVSIPLKPNFDEIVESLNESFKEEKVHLVGFSLGGYVASYFACKYAHRVEKVFVIASSPCLLPQDEVKKRKEVIAFVQTYGFKGLSRQKVISLLEEKNRTNEMMIQQIQTMYKQLGKNVFLMQMQATLERHDLMKPLNKSKVPFYFLYGDKDRLVNHQWMELFMKVSSNAIVDRLITRSHMLPLEKPKEVADSMKRFF